MQNVCYPTRELALAAPHGRFELSTCEQCGFSFNSMFEPALMHYDVGYDNHVESAAFQTYYERLARKLIERFDLDRGGIVYDVGCGAGTFLKVLCALCPSITGIGLDPACEPSERTNFKLLRAEFSADRIERGARLVLLRHVLEHVARPCDFMTELRVASRGSPIYVEVPDTQWIFRHGEFWDFCYEHCNYFTPATLRSCLRRAGFRVLESDLAFGDQYQWAIAADGVEDFEDVATGAVADAQAYAAVEQRCLEGARSVVSRAVGEGACALWGMATKGVVLAALLPDGQLTGGVDLNAKKQGLYAPASGLEIHPPGWLGELRGPVSAIVMNPNYLEEIRAQVDSLGFRVNLQTL
jgi:hypothetical protein